MKILTTQEMKSADKRTAEQFNVPFATLMENAGSAVARFILRELPDAGRIVIFCGKGNNGGDGLVAARKLTEAGRQITVLLLGKIDDVKGDARRMLDKLKLVTYGATPTEIASNEELNTPAIADLCASADLFIDAVFGTGFKPPMRGIAQAVGEILARYPNIPVVSVDLPSGWDADSRSFNQPGAFRSDAVLTFTAPKLAHVSGHLTQGGNLTRPGNLKQGPLVVANIGSPDEAIESTTGLTWAGASKQITDAPRSPDGNKGKFGHVLIIGGADGKAGAPAMASLSALRAGAGLVTAGIVSSILPNVASIAPELMTLPLLAGSSGAISSRNLDPANLKHLLEKKSVVAIGPGLGEDPDAQDFVLGLIEQTDLPMVIDADALNAIAQRKFNLDGTGRTIVLTPHPGEMSRLVYKSIKEVEANRENIARAYATTHQVTLVLKGWRSIIAHPDGRLAINTTGNPGLAKGGSGDILTGIVAALLSQYKGDPASAVAAAVYLHGLAADFAVAEQNEHTLLATDVIAHLWKAYRFHAEDKAAGYTWLQGLPGRLQ
jgi:NAD(P)H-hydrate epimerase